MNLLKSLIFTILLLFFVLPEGKSQNLFMKYYGDTLQEQRGGQVVVCPDGGYAIAGTTPGPSMDFYLVRTDEWGNFLWGRIYPNNDTFEVANRLIVTQDGGFAILGNSSQPGSIWREDIHLVVTDSVGNIVFQDTYGVPGSFVSERGYDLVQTSDKGFAFIGASFQQGGTYGQLYKIDSLGNYQSGKSWQSAVLYRIEETPDGGYIMAASHKSSGSGLRLIKIDSLYNTEWSRIIYSQWDDHRVKGVAPLPDGGYFTVVQRYLCSSCPSNADLWFVRSDSVGDTLWTKVIDGVEDYFPEDAIRNLDGNYTVVGYTRAPAPSYVFESFIMKLDTGANVFFRSLVPGNQINLPRSVVNHPDSGTVIGGSSWVINGDLFLLTMNDTCCLPMPLSVQASSTILCPGDSVVLHADSTGYPITWSTGDTSLVLAVTQPGRYYYDLLDSLGCPSRSVEVEITADSAAGPLISLIGSDSLCPGDSTALLADTSASGFQWSTGSTLDTLWLTQTGTYFATAQGACGTVYSDSVLVTALPAPAVSAGPDQDLCQGDSLWLLPFGAQTYQWASDPSLQSNGDSALVFPGSTTTYFLTGTSNLGCGGSDSVEVVVHPLPTPQLGPDTLICSNQSVVLHPGLFSNYQWSDGTGQDSLLVDAIVTGTGTFVYWVEVTDGQGCRGVDSVTVTVDVCVGLEERLAGKLVVAPNPTAGPCLLQYTGQLDFDSQVSLVDPFGRPLADWQWNSHSPLRLDLDGLDAGVYWLRVANESGVQVLRIGVMK